MNSLPRQYQWFIALAAGVTGITFFMGVTAWFINFILLSLFLGVLVITRTWHDRGFYLVCSGEALVISCSIMNLWAGLLAACMVAGIVCEALGLLESYQDLRPFALFCGVSFILTLLILVSNHVLLPLVILGSMTSLILVIQSVRSYQFRKHLTGG